MLVKIRMTVKVLYTLFRQGSDHTRRANRVDLRVDMII